MARQRGSRRRAPHTSSSSSGGGDASAADRYHALAEAMNARGAMELAVPFYRQALALLLAEREQWREAFPGQSPLTPALPADAMEGLLAAAELLEVGAADEPQPPVAREAVSLEELKELAEDLCAANAEQVLALLEGMDVQAAPAAVQAERLAVMGKALLLLEQLEASVAAYRDAMALAPERQELLINSGAALLLLGDSEEALQQLRQVELNADAPARQRTAWLRNRATAEERAGDGAMAQQLRLQLLQHNPDAHEPERWLAWAKQWREQGDGAAALQVLQVLRAGGGSGTELMEPLAELLEEQGAYREAALVYRELLRDGMNSAAEA